MAKVLFTAIVADMRNKLNGTVFSKNRYGAYTRTKVTPVNPTSTAQQAVRGRLGAMASAWRGLTETERQSWIDAAPSFPITDIFGNSKILSGQALYNKLNLNLAVSGNTEIATAPVPVAIPSLLGLNLTAAVTGTALTLSGSLATVPAGFSAVFEATPLYGAGISFIKNKYRVIANAPAAASINTFNLYSDWSDIFGSLVAGQKVSVRVKLISDTTGQAGVPFSATDIVAS